MLRLYLILTFIVLAKSVSGQPAIIREVSRTNPITKEKYIFPKIIMRRDSSGSQKINDILRFEILTTESETLDSQIFQKVWRTAVQSPTIHDLDYKINRNDKSILSITIRGQGCGAYCEAFESHFTFNSKTGNRIRLDSLFTKVGQKTLVDSMNQSKQKKLKTKIVQINHTLKSKTVQGDKRQHEYYTEMLGLYKECLAKNIVTKYMNHFEFLIKGKTLILFNERCSAHYNMTIDELWVFQYVINLNAWQKHLTEYGRSLAKL